MYVYVQLHSHDVAATIPIEENGIHTPLHHDCSAQHHHLCTHPGELEAEMREAILRVKIQTSPATFHGPMEMPEPNSIPINSHLLAYLPVVRM